MPDSLPAADAQAATDTVLTDVNTPAASSEAEPTGSQNKSMLDAVRSALDKGSEKSPGSETQDPKARELVTADPEGEVEVRKGFSPEEFQALSKKTQARIRSLVAKDKDTARFAESETKARQYDDLVGFMQRNKLSGDEVNSTFEIASLIKSDPNKALQRLAPIVRGLLEAAGMGNLPDELKAEVETGAITEARARELARARAGEKTATQRLQQTAEEREAEGKHRQASEIKRNVTEAADKWHAAQSSDPDWNLKQSRVLELVELDIRRNGYPATATVATELFDEVLKTVNAEFKRFAPSKKSRAGPVIGGAPSQSAAVPKTMKEAMELVIRKAG
jgi:hypothetical protein